MATYHALLFLGGGGARGRASFVINFCPRLVDLRVGVLFLRVVNLLLCAPVLICPDARIVLLCLAHGYVVLDKQWGWRRLVLRWFVSVAAI